MKRIKNFISNIIDWMLCLPNDYRFKEALLNAGFVLLGMILYYSLVHLETNSFEYSELKTKVYSAAIYSSDGEFITDENTKFKMTATLNNNTLEISKSYSKVHWRDWTIYVPLDVPIIYFLIAELAVFLIFFIIYVFRKD